MNMEKLNKFLIHGTYAHPSSVIDGKGNRLNLTKELLQNSIKRFNPPIFLDLEHDNKRVAVINTLTYDEDVDEIKYEGFAFDEEMQEKIMSGGYKLSPDLWTMGDMTNPEDVYFIGGALTKNPALKETSVEWGLVNMSDEVEGKTNESNSKVESILDSKTDLGAEIAKEHLRSEMKKSENKINSLTKELEKYKAEIAEIQQSRDEIGAKYQNFMSLEAQKLEQQMKELGYKDPSKMVTAVDPEVRLNIFKEIIENHVKSAPAQSPVQTEVKDTPKETSKYEYAKEHMKLSAQNLELLKSGDKA